MPTWWKINNIILGNFFLSEEKERSPQICWPVLLMEMVASTLPLEGSRITALVSNSRRSLTFHRRNKVFFLQESRKKSVLLKKIANQYFSDWQKARIKNVGVDGMDRIRLVSAPYQRDRVLDLFQGKLQSRKEIQLALFSEAVNYILADQHRLPKNKAQISRFVCRCRWIRDRHSDKCQKKCDRILRERARRRGGRQSRERVLASK